MADTRADNVEDQRGSEAGVASEVTAMGTGCERWLRAFTFHVITSDYLDEHIFADWLHSEVHVSIRLSIFQLNNVVQLPQDKMLPYRLEQICATLHQLFVATSNPVGLGNCAHVLMTTFHNCCRGWFFSIAATTKRFKHLIDTLMMSLSLSRRTMCWLSVLHGISFCFEVGLGKLLRRRVAGKVFKEKHRSFFLQNSCENKLVRVKSFPTEFGISHSIALTN